MGLRVGLLLGFCWTSTLMEGWCTLHWSVRRMPHYRLLQRSLVSCHWFFQVALAPELCRPNHMGGNRAHFREHQATSGGTWGFYGTLVENSWCTWWSICMTLMSLLQLLSLPIMVGSNCNRSQRLYIFFFFLLSILKILSKNNPSFGFLRLSIVLSSFKHNILLHCVGN